MMQLFVSDTGAREFSGFSIAEDVVPTENNKADAGKNVSSVNKKSDKPGLSKGSWKGLGKNKKGKAPLMGERFPKLKRANCPKVKWNTEICIILWKIFFYSYVQNKAGSSTPHNEQPDIDIQNMVDNEDSTLDLEDFNIYQAEAMDENNNAAVNSNEADEDEFIFEVPTFFEDDVKFDGETMSNIGDMINTIVR